jgi:chitin synthase
VYEYYISHHLTKAFESLFGSVTCLPGCFSVYRIRTADKGRPVIISSIVIDEYAEPNVDTLHKKNLFSLGEDRYLTTLMMKHFPTFKMKFTPDAIAHTVAPSRWNVLLSQRRRWINSTVHNLAELLFLPEMCGFCFFSMRFIVFIDLLGTIVSVTGLASVACVVSALTIADPPSDMRLREFSSHLPPASWRKNARTSRTDTTQLIYLIIVVSTGKAAIPVVSLIMIGAVYGLQVSKPLRLCSWLKLRVGPMLTLPGNHLHPQTRVHAHRLDVCVHLGVSVPGVIYSLSLEIVVIAWDCRCRLGSSLSLGTVVVGWDCQ